MRRADVWRAAIAAGLVGAWAAVLPVASAQAIPVAPEPTSSAGTPSAAPTLAVPTLPVPAARADTARRDTVVFSGGCFWGVQAVYQRVQGVDVATAGYAGGSAATAHYAQTSTGRTGHAESVRVIFDPDRVSYGTLLRVFFTVAHDPTEKNRQGPDIGSEYRSAIWTTSDEQAREARSFIRRLDGGHVFPKPIVTEVQPLDGFYPAETYHQDYLIHHPDQPYIVVNDVPKVKALRQEFPELWREEPAPWKGDGETPRR